MVPKQASDTRRSEEPRVRALQMCAAVVERADTPWVKDTAVRRLRQGRRGGKIMVASGRC
jgi:hypothetical protein